MWFANENHHQRVLTFLFVQRLASLFQRFQQNNVVNRLNVRMGMPENAKAKALNARHRYLVCVLAACFGGRIDKPWFVLQCMETS
jgi:hypothetical protein